MSNPVLKARVVKDGRFVEVYKLESGGFCNFKGCTERFAKEELEFIK